MALLKELIIGVSAAVFLAGCATLPPKVLNDTETIGEWQTTVTPSPANERVTEWQPGSN